MSGDAIEAAATDLPRLVISAGLVLVVLLILPGLPHPFGVPKEGVVCLVAGFTLLLIAAGPRRVVRRWPRTWSAILLAPLLMGTAAALVNGSALLASDGPLRFWVYGLLFLAIRLGCTEARHGAQLVRLAVVLGAVEGGVVVLQVTLAHRLFDLSALPSAKWRAFGTLGNPNWVGAYLAVTLPLALARLWSAEKRGERARSWLIAGLILVGLTLTLARGAWLAAACGVGALMLLDRRNEPRRAAVTCLIVAVALGAGIAWMSFGRHEVALALGRSGSLAGRIRMWQVSAAMTGARPLFGWGPGRFAGVYPAYQRSYVLARAGDLSTDLTDHPHNEYLYWAAEAGVPAALALCAVLVLALRQAIVAPCWRRAAPLAAGLATLAVYSLGDVPLRLPATATLGCLLVAAILSVASDRRAAIARDLSTAERLALAVFAALAVGQGARLFTVERHLADARIALQAGNAVAAAAAAQQGLDLEPGQGELWSIVAHARAALGDDDGALVAAQRARTLLPEPHLWYLIADIKRRQGRPERARTELQELSETLPGLLRPRILIGELYAEAGQTELARATLRQVVLMPSKFVNDDERQLRARAARALQGLQPHD